MHWKESVAAVVLASTPDRLGSQLPRSQREYLSLVRIARERFCWNKTVEVEGAGEKATMSEDLLSFLVGAINNMPNLKTVTSSRIRAIASTQRTRTLHLPTIFGVRGLDRGDDYFDLASLASMVGHVQPSYEHELNDGLFQFILPVLGRVEPRPWSLKVSNERGNAPCLARFADACIRRDALDNLTFLALTMPAASLRSAILGSKKGCDWRASIQWIECAKNLEILTLAEASCRTESDAFIEGTPIPEPGFIHFFDLLVWGSGSEGEPRQGPVHRWKRLGALNLTRICYDQLSLLRFLDTHSSTLHDLELDRCPLEFRAVKEMGQMAGLRLDSLSVTPPLSGVLARPPIQDPSKLFRDSEYIEKEKLLTYINTKLARVHITESEKWDALEMCSGTSISYDPSFNFFVVTNGGDVTVSLLLAGETPGSVILNGGLFIDRTREWWDRLRQEGEAWDFRDYGNGHYHPSFSLFKAEDLVYATRDTQETPGMPCSIMDRPPYLTLDPADSHRDTPPAPEQGSNGGMPEALKEASEVLPLALPGFDAESFWEGILKPTNVKGRWEVSSLAGRRQRGRERYKHRNRR